MTPPPQACRVRTSVTGFSRFYGAGLQISEMSEQTLHDPADSPAVRESRARVLDVLRVTPRAVGVREIAEQTGLHSNTARFHLDTPVREGLAERSTEGTASPADPAPSTTPALPPQRIARQSRSAAPAGGRGPSPR